MDKEEQSTRPASNSDEAAVKAVIVVQLIDQSNSRIAVLLEAAASADRRNQLHVPLAGLVHAVLGRAAPVPSLRRHVCRTRALSSSSPGASTGQHWSVGRSG